MASSQHVASEERVAPHGCEADEGDDWINHYRDSLTSELAGIGDQFLEVDTSDPEKTPAKFHLAGHPTTTEKKAHHIEQKAGPYAPHVTADDTRRGKEQPQCDSEQRGDRYFCIVKGCKRGPNGFRTRSEMRWVLVFWKSPGQSADKTDRKHQRCHVPEHEREYECHHCGRRFLYGAWLAEHEKSVHQKVRYYCPVCPNDYTRHDNRRKHVKQRHPHARLPERNGRCDPAIQGPSRSEGAVARVALPTSTNLVALERGAPTVHFQLDESQIDPRLRSVSSSAGLVPRCIGQDQTLLTYADVLRIPTPTQPPETSFGVLSASSGSAKHPRWNDTQESTSGSAYSARSTRSSNSKSGRKEQRLTPLGTSTPPTSTVSGPSQSRC